MAILLPAVRGALAGGGSGTPKRVTQAEHFRCNSSEQSRMSSKGKKNWNSKFFFFRGWMVHRDVGRLEIHQKLKKDSLLFILLIEIKVWLT